MNWVPRSRKPPVVNEGTKPCIGPCGRELPSTSEWFDKDVTKSDGLRNTCRDCRALERREKQQRSTQEKVEELDKEAIGMLDEMVRTGSDLPHLAEVYQHIMQAFEGAGGYAAHFLGQYLASKPGSSQRTKMLELITRISQRVSESGAAQLPVDLMADEDLQIAFEKGVEKFAPRVHHDDTEAKEAS